MKKQFQITLAMLTICFSVSAQDWFLLDPPTAKELKTIQFISDEIGFIGGDSVLLKTLDGGISWNEINSDLEGVGGVQYLDVYDLHFFDENHGYVMSGLYGAMLETFDGGITWSAVPVSDGFCQQASLYFENENYGFAGGAGCFEGHIIGKYENGTWTQTDDPQDWSGTNYVTTINFKNAELGFAGTINGKVLRTTNGGDTWDTIPNLATGFAITDIDFDGDLIRMSHHNVGQFGTMISMDDGLTWEFDPDLATFYYPEFNALHTTNGGVAYAAGRLGNNDFVDGIIFERQENFWNSVPLLYKINDIASHSDSTVFAVGEHGAIYTNQQSISNSIITEQEEKLTIYPNPAFQGVDVNLGVLNNTGFSIQVLDIYGKEVSARTFDGQISKNTISTEGLRSGVYLVQFYNNDSNLLKETRRLVIK